MRARIIKPSFFKSDTVAELPFWVRLLFQGLWAMADRRGILEDRPKKIKVEIFPYDDVDVEAGLRALESSGFIVRYNTSVTAAIGILNFCKHQHPHPKEIENGVEHYEKCISVESNGKKCFPTASSGKAGTSPSVSLPSFPSVTLTAVAAEEDLETQTEPETKAARQKPSAGNLVDLFGKPVGNIPEEKQTTEPISIVDAVENHITKTAQKIHDRHPPQRRCGRAVIAASLRTISKSIRGVDAKIQKLDLIDRNHTAWCQSEQWQKDGGEYAKGLENWLSPSKHRYDEPPENAHRLNLQPEPPRYRRLM